ncbi:MAG: hypothetical protein MZU79_09270 [Anaerotruncus sp.]|nr:hypothetical protein [Anaerotruncus sp.]
MSQSSSTDRNGVQIPIPGIKDIVVESRHASHRCTTVSSACQRCIQPDGIARLVI